MKTRNFTIAFAVFCSFSAFAQATSPPPPPGLPIDGGIWILLAAGLFFGAKKLKKD